MECWPSSGTTLAGFGVQGVLNYRVESKRNTVLFWRLKAWQPPKDAKCRRKGGECAGCSKGRVSKKNSFDTTWENREMETLYPDHSAPHLSRKDTGFETGDWIQPLASPLTSGLRKRSHTSTVPQCRHL